MILWKFYLNANNDDKTYYQDTCLGSSLHSNNNVDTPDGGGTSSSIVDNTHDSANNNLTGVGVSIIEFSTIVFSIVLLLIKNKN